MNRGPLHLRRVSLGAMLRLPLGRAYFAICPGFDEAEPLRKVLPPLPGCNVVPPLPGCSVVPPLPGCNVVPPLPGWDMSRCFAVVAWWDCADAAPPATGEVPTAWLAASVDVTAAVTQVITRRKFKECMVFSCKGVSENDLAGAHLTLASRRAAGLPGIDLPAAKAVVGERSMRNTEARPPCQGKCERKIGSGRITLPGAHAAVRARRGTHG